MSLWPLVLTATATAVTLTAVAVALTTQLALGARARRDARHHTRGRELLTAVVLGEIDVDTAAAGLRRLPGRVADDVLVWGADALADADRTTVADLADAAGRLHDASRRLGSHRWEPRLAAVRLLGSVGADGPVEAVLDDPRAEVRVAATLWLSRHPRVTGDRRARLLQRLLADDVTVATAAVYTATHVPDDGRRAAAARLAAAGSAGTVEALAVLASAPSAGAIADITGHLDADDPQVRAGATRALAAAAPTACGAWLPRLAGDPAPVVRRAAAEAAARDADAAGWLVDLADDPDWKVRQTARSALRHLSQARS